MQNTCRMVSYCTRQTQKLDLLCGRPKRFARLATTCTLFEPIDPCMLTRMHTASRDVRSKIRDGPGCWLVFVGSKPTNAQCLHPGL